MLIKEKLEEITGGNYHYKNKNVENLFSEELIDYAVWEHSGKTEHMLKSNLKAKRHGHILPQVLIVTFTNSGVNKGSWRIALSYRNF